MPCKGIPACGRTFERKEGFEVAAMGGIAGMDTI
jgi:hypothetical protein